MLELIGVSKSFGERLVLKGVNCKLEKGQGAVLFGPNGCGKSTLLKIIAGTLHPSSGKVILSNITKIGYMGHFWGVYSHLTAYENLKFWGDIYKVTFNKEQLLQILERVGLKDFIFEKVHIFSRGMIQRLNIARLMLIDPDLYLLDEPETGLDSASCNMLVSFVKKELKKGKIVVWVTHNKDIDFMDNTLIYNDKTFILSKR